MDRINEKKKSVMFNNLVLLGLNPVVFEEKHGIPFHKDMFDLSNKKGYEIVTHFLFSKLSAVTEKDYNVPWPLLNKELERTFQKACYSHLVNFSQENEVRFPRIVPSLLATCGGVRFYEVYFAFSCYVLKKKIRKNANVNLLSRPSVTQENFNSLCEMLQLYTIASKERFSEIETDTYIHDLTWTQFTRNLSECLQKLKQLQKNNTELLRIKAIAITNLYSAVSDEDHKPENLIEKCLNNLNEAHKVRKALDKFFSTEGEFWLYLASEIGENSNSEALDGQDFSIGIIDKLPEKFKVELEKVGFSCSTEDGKMSVVRFLKLLMAYIKSVTEVIKITDTKDICKIDVNDASSVEQDLLSINSFNKKLSEEVIPNLEENVRKLKLSYSFEDTENVSESPFNHICSLPVLSYNPESVKERLLRIDPNLEENLHLHSSEDIGCSDLGHAHSSITNLSQINTRTDATVGNTAVAGTSKQDLESEKTETSHLFKNIIHLDSYPSSSDLNISALGDLNFAPSGSFKMRRSWLHEESLNSMTLPNISFEDEE